jgi:hypothetical protein
MADYYILLNFSFFRPKLMTSSSVSRDMRSVILRAQTSGKNMTVWTHICNVLELSKVKDVLTIGNMKPDEDSSLG